MAASCFPHSPWPLEPSGGWPCSGVPVPPQQGHLCPEGSRRSLEQEPAGKGPWGGTSIRGWWQILGDVSSLPEGNYISFRLECPVGAFSFLPSTLLTVPHASHGPSWMEILPVELLPMEVEQRSLSVPRAMRSSAERENSEHLP